jgi:hypothetical protein
LPPDFNRDNIRLLVFSDSEDTGLQLVFDSKTLRVVALPDNDNINNKLPTTIHTQSTLSGLPPATVSARQLLFHSELISMSSCIETGK